jgi:exodeoxyribonuclease VII small subunit
MEPESTFESALDELEQIVSDLERGDTPLATSLTQYERGIRLLSHCHGLLDGAERVVALLAGVDAEGEPQTSPFDTTATADRERPSSSKSPQRK